jgi:hypothetical protein
MADFIVHETLLDIDNRQEQLRKLLSEMNETHNTTYHRASIDENTNELYLEGWLVRPDDQGPLPFDTNKVE